MDLASNATELVQGRMDRIAMDLATGSALVHLRDKGSLFFVGPFPILGQPSTLGHGPQRKRRLFLHRKFLAVLTEEELGLLLRFSAFQSIRRYYLTEIVLVVFALTGAFYPDILKAILHRHSPFDLTTLAYCFLPIAALLGLIAFIGQRRIEREALVRLRTSYSAELTSRILGQIEEKAKLIRPRAYNQFKRWRDEVTQMELPAPA